MAGALGSKEAERLALDSSRSHLTGQPPAEPRGEKSTAKDTRPQTGRRTGQADGFTNSAYWLELVKLGAEGKDKQKGRSGGRCAGGAPPNKKVPIKK